MAFVNAVNVGAEVLKAMGMDPHNVADFSIHFNINEAVALHMKVLLEQDQVEALKVVLKKYDVVFWEHNDE